GTEENGDDEIDNIDDNGNDEETETEEKTKKKKFVPIEISETGLELIEMISLDCSNKEGIWTSDYEIKMDKNGYVIKNGQKTKEFWDGTISSEKTPLRMKVRNIAGDETEIILSENKNIP
ncbi:MAG: hypothetical protein QM536_04460, partial [Chitinophagaceae bacterium]|nr:hypothetical protein [Chitinophagaceae bacterium]